MSLFRHYVPLELEGAILIRAHLEGNLDSEGNLDPDEDPYREGNLDHDDEDDPDDEDDDFG